MICGGTGEAKEATAEVQELVNGLRSELEKEEVGSTMAAGILEATHFKTQVVAGTNYFVRVRDSSGSHFHLRIYKHFSGSVQLSGVKCAQEEEELVYFERS